MLALFTSTYTNKVDKKGRVSVPPAFRALATDQGFPGIIVFPALEHPALDGCGKLYFERLCAAIDDLPPFSDEREAFATAIIGASQQMNFDTEGRITLPGTLMSDLGITDTVAFVGLGHYFRLWEPQAFAEVRAASAKTALANRPRLNWPGSGKGGLQ